MFTGGISPFSYTAYPAGGFLQNTGIKPLAAQTDFGVPLRQTSVKPTTGNAGLFNADEGPDWVGMIKTMMAPMLKQFGLDVPGITSTDDSENPDTESEETDSEEAAKKWKATLKSAARVQDNVEAVKVSPPDDSGYYSSLSCYSDS